MRSQYFLKPFTIPKARFKCNKVSIGRNFIQLIQNYLSFENIL